MITLYPHQEKMINEARPILDKHNIVYITAEPRTGKSLATIFLVKDYRNILVLTKKSAISSWISDLELADCFNFVVTNYESVHKVSGDFDMLVCDEVHYVGSSFPKPSKRASKIKDMFSHLPMVFLSATPSAEAYSQLFHQFWISNFTPYKQSTFYKWYADYGTPDSFIYNGRTIKPYKDISPNVLNMVKYLMVSMTKEEAKFDIIVEEKVHLLKMPIELSIFADKLQKDDKIIIENNLIEAEDSVKKINKLHQFCGGTIKINDEKSIVISTFKVDYIKKNSSNNKKVVVLCNYVKERELLLKELPNSTDNIEDFKNNDYNFFIGHIKKYSEGVDFSYADTMIIYSLNFSATTYIQSKERLANKKRKDKIVVHYLLVSGSIDEYVYRAVKDKMNFTASYYKKTTNCNYL